MDLDDILGVENRAKTVDDLIRTSSAALDALHLLYADLVRQHGRDEGFERMVAHLTKSSLGSVEGAVGTCGLLAILLVKEADRNSRIEDVARLIYNTERPNGTDHWLTATEDERNGALIRAMACQEVFNGIMTEKDTTR